ncbi:hypothetical protein [Candidatus Similichlamydia epinepheli]|uniref:hypothetical protein n=1 Tax=Candidatus Similichlamydia epinepheli TaxID=1903953 RepID=UPI0013006551|nr:hypothetical protein [Candidatus Similichlamydia epinepheli]
MENTSYKANARNINCTTYGTEVIIPCLAGISGDADIVLQVNLGPITKESLIAIDLVKTQFETYSNAIGSPLNGTEVHISNRLGTLLWMLLSFNSSRYE